MNLKRDAVLSECGNYRYVLTRETSVPLRWVKPCLFIMLNPSTASAYVDDPTIRKCIYYAEREGCTSLTVINLYGLRSTDPKVLLDHKDPVGKDNMNHVFDQIEKHHMGLVIAAWGSHSSVSKYATYMIKEACNRYKVELKCLAINQDGNPRHPLYVPKSQELRNYVL